jgi:hypothetical protein
MMNYFFVFVMACLALFSCASSRIELEDVYFKNPSKDRLISSVEYHNEVIARKDISPICADIIINNAGPSKNIIVELKPVGDGRVRLINMIYDRQDQDIAYCIQEVLQKYDFPELSIVNFKKVYRDGTYYSFSKVFKCRSNNYDEKFRYEFEPFTADEFKRAFSTWDAFVVSLSAWSLGCRS